MDEVDCSCCCCGGGDAAGVNLFDAIIVDVIELLSLLCGGLLAEVSITW